MISKRRQGLSERECPTELHVGIYIRTSTQYKSGTKMKEEDNFTDEDDLPYPVHRKCLL